MIDAADQCKMIDRNAKEAILDAQAKELAEQRDEDSKFDIRFKRYLLIFFTLIVMAVGWVGIAFVFYFENQFYMVFS